MKENLDFSVWISMPIHCTASTRLHSQIELILGKGPARSQHQSCGDTLVILCSELPASHSSLCKNHV
jgi:hypothetical protein